MFLKFSKGFFFFFFSFPISGHWYISELLCGFPPSLFPSSPSWNVILSMKYDGELKCPWWSIVGLDFYSHQWQKLTNSDIGVPEHVSPLWLVLSGIFKVWVPHPTYDHSITPRSNFKRVSGRSLKMQLQVHLRMKISGLHACLRACMFILTR